VNLWRSYNWNRVADRSLRVERERKKARAEVLLPFKTSIGRWRNLGAFTRGWSWLFALDDDVDDDEGAMYYGR
jgi:hypothetical protein